MRTPEWKPLLELVTAESLAWLHALPERPVQARSDFDQIRRTLPEQLQAERLPADEVVAELVRLAEPGLTAMPSGRYFGYVIGGGLPAAVAADWLTTVWDQNAAMAGPTPAAMAIEDQAARWIVDLLGLPAGSGVGFVTGCQMAHVTALATARDAVLDALGWDAAGDGLTGAPPIHTVVSETCHDTVPRAFRLTGLGTGATRVATDDQGRMRPDALADVLADDRPAIVCAQVGEVNTGSVDPLPPITRLVQERRERAPTWLHVDGAFGLWAAAGNTTRHLVDQLHVADSWATDGHKWLNVPYDCGIAICADRAAMHRAMSVHGDYLPDPAGDARRDALDTTPEFSRRARGFAVWAALRHLGRSGVAGLVDDLVAMAQRFRDRLDGVSGIEVVNEPGLNQVLVRLRAPDGDDAVHTARVLRELQDDGTCVMTGTRWQGAPHVRISVSNWSTTADDVDRSADALIRIHRS